MDPMNTNVLYPTIQVQQTAASNQVSQRTDATDKVLQQDAASSHVLLRTNAADRLHQQAASSNQVAQLTNAADQGHRQTNDSNAAHPTAGGTDQMHEANGSGYVQQRPGATDNRALPYGPINVHQRGARPCHDPQSGHEIASYSTQMEELRISEDAPRPTPESVMQSMIEDEVLCHFDQINALRQVGAITTENRLNGAFTNWTQVEQSLRTLAYVPGSACPWKLLGIPKDEGPPPSVEQIDRRARFASLLTSARSASCWTDSDTTAALNFETAIENARNNCICELRKVLQQRRKLRPAILPRWQEPSPELMEFIHNRACAAGPRHKVALHLSDLQSIGFDSFPQALQPECARPVCESLHKGSGTALQALAHFANGGLTTWAPNDKTINQ